MADDGGSYGVKTTVEVTEINIINNHYLSKTKIVIKCEKNLSSHDVQLVCLTNCSRCSDDKKTDHKRFQSQSSSCHSSLATTTGAGAVLDEIVQQGSGTQTERETDWDALL